MKRDQHFDWTQLNMAKTFHLYMRQPSSTTWITHVHRSGFLKCAFRQTTIKCCSNIKCIFFFITWKINLQCLWSSFAKRMTIHCETVTSTQSCLFIELKSFYVQIKNPTYNSSKKKFSIINHLNNAYSEIVADLYESIWAKSNPNSTMFIDLIIVFAKGRTKNCAFW
jgi:hypothetical protein